MIKVLKVTVASPLSFSYLLINLTLAELSLKHRRAMVRNLSLNSMKI